jgi:cyanophycinase
MVDVPSRRVRLVAMRTLLPIVALVSLLAAGLFAQDRAGAAAPKGKLVIVGGGGTTDEIVTRALTMAGGKDVRMLIVPQAANDAEESGESSRKFWAEKGATHVSVMDHHDIKASLAAIEKADFIWIPGGDQSRLTELLGKTPLPAAMRKRYQDGAVVGGTSAGAAIMSRTMLIGGEKADLENIKSGGSEVEEGFGFWPEAIVDQHFVKRQRFTRLLTCVIDHPELLGVGIDEKTAVIVDGMHCEVMGESSVLVIDARGAHKRAPKEGETLSATDLKLHVLHRGDTFEIAPVAAK